MLLGGDDCGNWVVSHGCATAATNEPMSCLWVQTWLEEIVPCLTNQELKPDGGIGWNNVELQLTEFGVLKNELVGKHNTLSRNPRPT